MTHADFLKVVSKLKEDCNSFGNQMLYNMANKENFRDGKKFADTMWVIGRAYAASPQRRSYGTKQNGFPVRPDNDGRGQFFSVIANTFKDFEFPELPAFTYEGDIEKETLQQSASLVLRFNQKLSEAIEKFDCAPEGIHCTNHISFSSKFLHFYYPESVFIIDNYAQIGAGHMFGKRKQGRFAYICDPDQKITYNPLQMNYFQINGEHREYYFAQDVYENILPENMDRIVKRVAEACELKDDRYITHCVRSYLLARHLKQNGLDDCLMPRLVDTVFLNIKGKLDKVELDHYCQLAQRYEGFAEKYKNTDKEKEFTEILENYKLADKIKEARYCDKY